MEAVKSRGLIPVRDNGDDGGEKDKVWKQEERGRKERMREQKAGEKTRVRKRRGNVSFSRWPASSAPPPSTPPSPLGSQVAGLGTDGPPSLLHAGPAGPSKHEAAVVGGHRPDMVQRKDGQAVFEGLAHTYSHTPSTQRTRRTEDSLASSRRLFQSNCFQEKWHKTASVGHLTGPRRV